MCYFIDAHALRSRCSLHRRTVVRFVVIHGKFQSDILLNETDQTPSFDEIYNVVTVLRILSLDGVIVLGKFEKSLERFSHLLILIPG